MINRLIVTIFTVLITFSCSDEKTPSQAVLIKDQTPDVLDKNESDINLSSYNKRMNSDIIQRLFDEAIAHDEQLKTLNKRIYDIEGVKNDSLERFNIYIRNNQDYWNTLNQYINQLNDTLLRDDLNLVVERLEDRYTSKVLPLNTIVSNIELSQKSLVDQQIIMKILVTEPMMRNYQNNELPDIKTLKTVERSYDTLIEDIKSYTQFDK
ncbi:MAG: hypothetical protein OCD76_17385 [Reichenbachiella sp.]